MDDLDVIANKVADILIARFKKEQEEFVRRQAELLWNIPINVDKNNDQ